jgi:hypothetical protein
MSQGKPAEAWIFGRSYKRCVLSLFHETRLRKLPLIGAKRCGNYRQRPAHLGSGMRRLAEEREIIDNE